MGVKASVELSDSNPNWVVAGQSAIHARQFAEYASAWLWSAKNLANGCGLRPLSAHSRQ